MYAILTEENPSSSSIVYIDQTQSNVIPTLTNRSRINLHIINQIRRSNRLQEKVNPNIRRGLSRREHDGVQMPSARGVILRADGIERDMIDHDSDEA